MAVCWGVVNKVPAGTRTDTCHRAEEVAGTTSLPPLSFSLFPDNSSPCQTWFEGVGPTWLGSASTTNRTKTPEAPADFPCCLWPLTLRVFLVLFQCCWSLKSSSRAGHNLLTALGLTWTANHYRDVKQTGRDEGYKTRWGKKTQQISRENWAFFQSAASQQRDFRSEFAQCLHGKGEHSPGLLCSGSNWVLKLNSQFLGISLQMLLMKF